MKLKDKVAIITGAGAGIGQATALLLLKKEQKWLWQRWIQEPGRRC